MPQLLINGKNTVPVRAVNEFEGHTVGAFLGILNATGRAETTFAAEGNKLHISAVRATVHGAPKRGVTTVNHLVNVIDNNFRGRGVEVSQPLIYFL